MLTIGNVYVTAKNYVDAIHYKHIFFLSVAFLFSSFVFNNILLIFFLHNFPFLGIIHKSSIPKFFLIQLYCLTAWIFLNQLFYIISHL